MQFSRRDFTAMSLAYLAPGLCFSKEDLPYSDPIAADQWVDSWMRSTRSANGALHVLRFSDGMYCLTRKIGWSPNENQKRLAPVSVPVGFVTDFASIPRVFWSLLPKDGKYTFAAIIHDYLYWTQSIPRRDADEVFKNAMEDFDVDKLTIGAIYTAVRLGGESAWDKNARLKSGGEKRLLKKLPEDPLISWGTWKLNPSNF